MNMLSQCVYYNLYAYTTISMPFLKHFIEVYYKDL